MLWAKLQILNNRPLYICSFYRPPNNNAIPISILKDSLSDIFNNETSQLPQILLAGDFNSPSISWTDGIGQVNPNPTYGTEVNQLLLESVNEFGLDQLVTEPTRGGNILDLLFSTNSESIDNVEVIPGMSDHEAVYCELTLKNRPESDDIKHPIFLYDRGNMTQLKLDLSAFQTEFLTSDPYSNTVQENWESFKQAINTAINENIPQTMSRATKELPWITRNIKRQMKQRKRLYNKAKHLQTAEAWQDYRTAKNNVTTLIRESHKNYQNKMFSNDSGINYKKFWKYIKTVRKDSHGIAPLKVDNSLVHHSEGQAEILNKQFQSVFTKEDLSDVPECSGSAVPPLHNVTISIDGVKKLLSTLDSSKSCGPDNIPARILKYCSDEIAPILTVIFTQSLNSGNLPEDWLTANITPIFKKGDRAHPTNYRPISLTSICCKLLEHILYHCITEHLNTYQILSDKQYGFRPNHSCESQLLRVVEEIQLAMDHHLSVDLIFIDFRKAFDTVPHQRLLKKLHHYGIQGKIYNWIASWLTKRTQRVVIKGHSSTYVNVDSGVPQGTVLGPLMFLLYINDITTNISSSIRLFADDCVLYRIIQSEQDHHHLQQDLNCIIDWTKRWQMNLNISKCVILTCSRSTAPPAYHYYINNTILNRTNQHLYLGVLFHSEMSFSPHINIITSNAMKSLNFVRRNLNNCTESVKAAAYLGLVRPKLEYASAVWDPYLSKDINSIERVQRIAARWVKSNYNWENSVSSMLSELQWPTLHVRRQISRLTIFYKGLHNLITLEMPTYILPTTTTSHVTRFQHPFHFNIPTARTNFYHNSYFPKTVRDWNSLPIPMIEACTVNSFCTQLCNLY